MSQLRKGAVVPSAKYVMTISRMTVDKLGVRLYDRVSAVIAELVAHGYDADATEVTVEAPMGVMLASLHKGQVSDSGHEIVVSDNGTGMHPDVVNGFYLKVGGNVERIRFVATAAVGSAKPSWAGRALANWRPSASATRSRS